MKKLNQFFTISLPLAGIALIVVAIIFKAYFHIGTGVALLLLSAAWRKEAKSI
jgi:hypothetical protein